MPTVARARPHLAAGLALLASLALAIALVPSAVAASETSEPQHMDGQLDEEGGPANPNGRSGFEPCVDGMAGDFPCHKVDLLSYMPIDDIGGGPGSQYGGAGNDVWGWVDPDTGQEWAIQGRTNGTSFVDITDPRRPVYVANVPTQTFSSLWRDIKTYDTYAFIVSEAGGHGMQVFDMTRLRDVDYDDAPVDLEPDAHYDGFGGAHNLVINEDSGFAYGVGTNTFGGGLHMVDVRDPLNPEFAGSYSGEGYVHDANCVTYHGPDEDFQGHEICFMSNPSSPASVGIVDMSDPDNPELLSRGVYTPSGYSHQGWVTEDHRYYLHNDEFNESITGRNSMTHSFDISDLRNPEFLGTNDGETPAITHNIYNVGRYSYQANYFAGLRILDITGLPDPEMEEVAYFQVSEEVPTAFGGAWSVYPFLDSNTVLIGGFDGLWMVKPRLPMNAPWPAPGQDHRHASHRGNAPDHAAAGN